MQVVVPDRRSARVAAPVNGFRVDVIGAAGSALTRGLFNLLHVELVDGTDLVLTGRDELGRRATVRIPCEMIEEVPAAGPDPTMRACLILRAGTGAG